MDKNPFASMTFADFRDRMSHMTIDELRKDAVDVFEREVPADAKRKIDVLRAVFEMGGGQVEPEGEPQHPVEAPPASAYAAPAAPAAPAETGYRLLFRRSPGGYRCGRFWRKGYTSFNPDEWSDRELAMFEADSRISIKPALPKRG